MYMGYSGSLINRPHSGIMEEGASVKQQELSRVEAKVK
jgi:hypothetical protein